MIEEEMERVGKSGERIRDYDRASQRKRKYREITRMHDARRLRNGGSMDQWMEFAMRVQSIAQADLPTVEPEYDKGALRSCGTAAAEMLCVGTKCRWIR